MIAGSRQSGEDPLRILAVATLAAAVVLSIASIVVPAILPSDPPLPGDNGKAIATVRIDEEQFDGIARMVTDATGRQSDISREIADIRSGVEGLRSEVRDGVAAIGEQGNRIVDSIAAIAEQTGRIADGAAAIGKGGGGTLQEEDELPGNCSDSDGCLGELYFVHDWPPERENICEYAKEFSQKHFAELNSIAAKLREKGPEKVVLVEGHASNYGEKKFVEGHASDYWGKKQNLALSQRRAEIVACYLKQELMNGNGGSEYCFSPSGKSASEHRQNRYDSDSNYRKVRVVLGQNECRLAQV